MHVEPIEWPVDFRALSFFDRLTRSIPGIGIESRMHRLISAQLRARTFRVLELWGDDARRMSVFAFVACIIREDAHWPNIFFVPSDSLNLLLWDPSMGMRDVTSRCVVTEALNVGTEEALNEPGMELGVYIDRLRDLSPLVAGDEKVSGTFS